MKSVRLIHWNEEEAAERAERLRRLGYEAESGPLHGPEDLKKLRADPPAAVVIDLGRIPSQGRDVAIALRSYKDTRAVPIVFVAGDPVKVERTKAHLPDAAYTDWGNIGPALKTAISGPPAKPVVPDSRMEAYRGAPLPKKLGIKPGTEVYLVAPPRGFEKTLADIPEGAALKRAAGPAGLRRAHFPARMGRARRLILWFVPTRRELEQGIKTVAALAPDGGMWIIWPKKSSGRPSDLNQTIVRAEGLACGLVDYKICAVDETWAGLLFARRK